MPAGLAAGGFGFAAPACCLFATYVSLPQRALIFAAPTQSRQPTRPEHHMLFGFDVRHGRQIIAALLGSLMIWLAVALPNSAVASLSDPLPLAPIESRMLLDGAGGRFQSFSLIEASLVASGVNSPAELNRLNQKYLGWLSDARAIAAQSQTDEARAKAIYAFMHRRILTAH